MTSSDDILASQMLPITATSYLALRAFPEPEDDYQTLSLEVYWTNRVGEEWNIVGEDTPSLFTRESEWGVHQGDTNWAWSIEYKQLSICPSNSICSNTDHIVLAATSVYIVDVSRHLGGTRDEVHPTTDTKHWLRCIFS